MRPARDSKALDSEALDSEAQDSEALDSEARDSKAQDSEAWDSKAQDREARDSGACPGQWGALGTAGPAQGSVCGAAERTPCHCPKLLLLSLMGGPAGGSMQDRKLTPREPGPTHRRDEFLLCLQTSRGPPAC